jgi:hypothetical protein
MTIEFSIPKFKYGHNISLLYDWVAELEVLKESLKEWFGWRSLPNVENWLVGRVDFCYVWRLPDEDTALSLIELMKRLKFPYKKPQHYPGTAFWPGGKHGTFSAKMYAKGQEFRANDLPKLIEANSDSDWLNNLEERAKRQVRFEITGRPRLLKQLGIKTVADLMGEAVTYTVTPELWAWVKDLVKMSEWTLTPIKDPSRVIEMLLLRATAQGALPSEEEPYGPFGPIAYELKKGQTVDIPEMNTAPDADGNRVTIPAGSIRVEIQSKTEYVLQTYFKKLVGSGDMSNADEVKEILQKYHPGAKGGRLYQTWLMIQREGVEEAKRMLGNDAFYRDVRKLRSLGINILEKTGVLINPDNEFWSRFKLEIPSPFVENVVDEDRTGDNLINMMHRAESERQPG